MEEEASGTYELLVEAHTLCRNLGFAGYLYENLNIAWTQGACIS